MNAYKEKAIKLILQNGINGNKIYNIIDNLNKSKILNKNIRTKNDLVEYLKLLLNNYHKHSFVYIQRNKQNNINLDDQKLPEFSYDDKQIGTIKFYHFYGSNKTIEKEFIKLVKNNYNKWLKCGLKKLNIDLTEHYGGNMWPATKSLFHILGNTTLFAWSKNKPKKSDSVWYNIKNNKLFIGKYITKNIKYKHPIDVYISNKTSSSGEIIASIFIGRNNTKLYGLKTSTSAGYFSVNQSFKLYKNIYLTLTTSLVTTVDNVFHDKEILYVNNVRKII